MTESVPNPTDSSRDVASRVSKFTASHARLARGVLLTAAGATVLFGVLGVIDGWRARDVPTPWPQPHNLIDQLGAEGKADAALSGLKLTLLLTPARPVAEGLLAAGRMRGDTAAQIEALEYLAANDPAPEHLTALGQLRLQAGRAAEARELFERARTLAGPRDPGALLGLAAAAEGLGEHDKAIQAYQQVLAADPANVPALLGLADLLARLGRAEDSLRLYDAVLARDTRNVTAMNNRAILLANGGNPQEALRTLRLALETEPSNPRTHANLAVLYNMLNDPASAGYHQAEADRLRKSPPPAPLEVVPGPASAGGAAPAHSPRPY